MVTQAAAAGHVVDLLAPSRLAPSALTRHVSRVHRVPAFGLDPEGWLEAALAVLRRGEHDVLLPTQEQVATLARDADRVRALGVALAVPPFASLRRVQDKVSAFATLTELELPQPPTRIVATAPELLEVDLPAYVKAPIGTASAGVRLARSRADLVAAANAFGGAAEPAAPGARTDRFPDGGLVVQRPLAGPLAMVQAVFDRGALVAWHANLRVREGVNGGAAAKRGVRPAAIEDHLRRFGRALDWHGALGLDAILGEGGPHYIDVNPRLIEPGNAWRSGVDLVDAMLRVSLGHAPSQAPPPRTGVRTHQLLLALLGAAQGGGRRAVARELAAAARRRGPYTDSAEELTPAHGDPLACVPVSAIAVATLAHPPAWRWFADGAVSAYALTPEAWRRLVVPRSSSA